MRRLRKLGPVRGRQRSKPRRSTAYWLRTALAAWQSRGLAARWGAQPGLGLVRVGAQLTHRLGDLAGRGGLAASAIRSVLAVPPLDPRIALGAAVVAALGFDTGRRLLAIAIPMPPGWRLG